MGKLLTIAIPTFNRADLLKNALESLVDQIDTETELCNLVDILVVDNASTDHTQLILKEYSERFRFISFRTNSVNTGIDGNIYRCGLFAKSEYVHLLSDDDVVIPGGIKKIVDSIRNAPEIDFFFLNIRPFSGEFDVTTLGKSPFTITSDTVFADPNQFVELCWVYLTFLSSFVFRRCSWFSQNNHENYIGTDIYLSYALFDLLVHSKSMMFVADPIIGIRAHFSGNYRMFYAFAYQWRKLLLVHAPQVGFDLSAMKRIFKRSICHDLRPRVINYRVNHSEIDPRTRSLIYDNTKDVAISWICLYPFVYIPRFMLNIIYALAKPIQRLLQQQSV